VNQTIKPIKTEPFVSRETADSVLLLFSFVMVFSILIYEIMTDPSMFFYGYPCPLSRHLIGKFFAHVHDHVSQL